MEMNADPLEKLRTRTSEKWREFGDDVLPLFVAEMDYPLAEPVADALVAAIGRSDTGYAGAGSDLPDAFARFALDRWGWQVDPAQVSTTTDVSVVIVEALRLVLEPGDGVIVMPPVYPPFFDLPREAGGTVVEVPLVDDGHESSIDLEGIERAFSTGARAVLLCSPHNPLGLVHSREQLTALAEIVDRHGGFVVSDEIHAPLTHRDARFTPYLTVSDAAREHGIAAESASKAFNLAGLKCAMFVTAGERMARLVHALPEEVHFRTSLFGRIASTVALTEATGWLDSVIDAIELNRRLLTGLLSEHMPSVEYREPHASYLAWLGLEPLGWGDDPARRALADARVALSNGPTFGAEGRGFARLNFACSADVLRQAIERLAAASAR
ncbi:aminotransferase class I/II-fold pyridoxal phosphate-dependent enzyme [Microbacterium sp. STN6]|uniref:MalY/PatB family protein n=1 Tax=Microbacterium sp. STN6 TaxID=2995588 RepID=UPI002260FE7E|nr:aminotransferase class I/II-fold pyridoxal phosphate-dependent enzyme [Microbacterium sp. STN6]MCX7523270.1 aminotransferase class I/II-fold pyridoxal phosphate-dependent enzyme [Microbacterium sp. STN6]